jgi:hypothetical protein
MSTRDSATGNTRGLFRSTLYFTFDLQVIEAGVASQLEVFESSPFRTRRLKTASIINFSRSADGSPDIRGYISGKTMWQSTVQTWLTNSALSNLQLHPISGCPGPGDAGGGRRRGNPGEVATPTPFPRPPGQRSQTIICIYYT